MSNEKRYGGLTPEQLRIACERLPRHTAEIVAEMLDHIAELEQQVKGKVSSTFGDLKRACETLAHRVPGEDGSVWDNMPMWEQRDWVIEQAEIIHQQWSKKWTNTLDRDRAVLYRSFGCGAGSRDCVPQRMRNTVVGEGVMGNWA